MKKIIEYSPLEDFALDPENPRLGRNSYQQDLSQDEIFDRMSSWSLDELATSFLESGFWPQEAILCLPVTGFDPFKFVVVEGNRRIAAMRALKLAFEGKPLSRKWAALVENIEPGALFDEIPYIEIESRDEVDSFLGFRHVTGIKEWAPAEKAQFIAHLINDRELSYVEVMRQIGSKTETVRRNYLAYSMLLQMEGIEGIDINSVEGKFSVLFLSLRARGVQEFLGVDVDAEPAELSTPVDSDHLNNLKDYSRWLFGTEEEAPIVKDSRLVDKFAVVLSSQKAVDYLRTARRPRIDKAYAVAGGEEAEVQDLIYSAIYSVEEALSTIHLYKESDEIKASVERLVKGVTQIHKSVQS